MRDMTSRHAAKPGVALGWDATALGYENPQGLGDSGYLARRLSSLKGCAAM